MRSAGVADLVIDTNVVIDCDVPGRKEDQAYALAVLRDMIQNPRDRIIVPPHWDTEVGAVLLRAMRAGRIGEAELDAAMDDLANLPVNVLHLLPNFRAVVEAGRHFGCSGYDAAFAAIGYGMQCPVATADRGLRAACQRHGVEVFSPPGWNNGLH